MTRVGIVDGHSLFRQGLKAILEADNYSCTLIKDSSLVLKEKFEQLSIEEIPEVLFLEKRISEENGFELISWLKSNYPKTKIIILSDSERDFDIIKMVKLGINAFISKNTSFEEFFETIKMVLKNGTYFSGETTKVLVNHIKEGGSDSLDNLLSDREKELVGLICRELTSRQIAAKLNLSNRTVENHKRRIMEKLQVNNTAGIIMAAIKNKLVQL